MTTHWLNLVKCLFSFTQMKYCYNPITHTHFLGLLSHGNGQGTKSKIQCVLFDSAEIFAEALFKFGDGMYH